MVFQNFESADGTYYSREQLPENAYSRVEQYLRELCLLEGSPLPVPQTRIEKLLNCLVTGESDFEEPRSRIEGLIYALITGDESNIETCASRVEVLWYMLVKDLDAEALLGTEVNGKVVEDCFSRVESYLWNLLHNSGLGDPVLYELNNQVTMYNTIAKSVNNGTLLGNTMVNIVGDNVIVEGETISNQYELPALQSATYTIQNNGTPFTLNGVEYGVGEQTIDNFGKIAEIEEGFQTDYTYETLKAEGETLINILPEPTLHNSMENVKMQKLNEGYDEVNTVDGVVKSAILKGNTLVNLVPKANVSLATGDISRYSNVHSELNYLTATVNSSLQGSWHYVKSPINLSLLKPNTKYLVKFDQIQGINSISIKRGNGIKHLTNNGVINSNHAILTTNSLIEIDNQILYLELPSSTPVGTKIIVSNPMIIEYQEDMENWDIPYFEGMQSVKMPVLTTRGKNLNNQSYIRGVLDVDTGGYSDILSRVTLSNHIKINPNTTYSYKLFSETLNFRAIYLYDINNDFIGITSPYYKTDTFDSGDAHYLNFCAYTLGDIPITQDEINNANFMIIEGEAKPASFEPHKSNILTTNEEVTLRGIGDVRDELNLLTGELTQRIGEIELSADAEWYKLKESNNEIVFYLTGIGDKIGKSADVLSNNFLTSKNWYDVVDDNDINKEIIYYATNNHHIYIRIKKIKLSTYEINGFKKWLNSNKTYMQYELATESVKTVDLSILDQDSAEVTELNSFANGHIQLSSNVADGEYSLVPSVDYEVLTSNSYHVDMATVGNSYTVKGDDTNELITYSDPCIIAEDTNLMMIEGDYTERSISYFEGMQSVKMSVLSTTGKNLICVGRGYDNSMTVSGVTITRDVVNQTITFNGTSGTDNLSYQLDSFFTQKIKAGERYAFSCYLVNGTADHVSFRANIRDWSNNMGCDVNKPHYKTFNKDVVCDSCSFRIDSGATFNNAVFKVMFERIDVNSSTTSYEPYKTNILSMSEEITLRSNGETYDELNLLTGEFIQRIDEENELLETETTRTIEFSIVNQDDETIDALEYFENGHLYIDNTYNLGHFTYSPNITGRKQLISISTVSDQILTTEDENMVIVKGNQLDETIPALEGRKLSAVKNPTITLSDEDGTNSNSANFEGSFYKIPNFDADATTLNGETTRNSRLLSYNDLTTTWALNSTMASQFNTIAFISSVELLSSAANSVVGTYNNLFGDYKANDLFITDCEGVAIYNDQLCIRVNRARLETEDVDGLETYLATNEFECLYVVDEYIENVVVNGELSSYDGITIATVSSENNVLPTVSLQVETSNRKDLEAIATGYTLLENTQSETSTAIEEQESDIQTVSDELSETSDLESIILEMTNQTEGE